MCVNSKGEEIKHFTEITYFKRNGIRLKRIFTNPMALAVFFLSDKGALYGAGKNHLLGTESPNKAVAEPIRIDSLQNVIDVTTAWYDYSVALCAADLENASSIIDVINQWAKTNGMNLPLDISKEIVSFMAVIKVFHTTSGGWKEMKPFVDAQTTITRVVMNGEEQTMLLDGDGNLWEMHRVGFPHDYACGQMPYFSQNGIRIKDIQCGQGHVLALSEDGDVYSWGLNYSGECGNEKHSWMSVDFTKVVPHCINLPHGTGKVDTIRCGWGHSCISTENGEHFTFGENRNDECLAFDDKACVKQPLRCRISKVTAIYPGFKNTKLLFEHVV